MARAARYAAVTAILTVVFMVLTEEFSPAFFIYGILISIFALAFTRWLLPEQNLSKFSRINPFRLMLYIPYLFYTMTTSACQSIVLLIKRAEAATYEYPTILKGDFKINLLANSITLTPGTVCVEHRGDKLLIMQHVMPGSEPDTSVIRRMEKLIEKI